MTADLAQWTMENTGLTVMIWLGIGCVLAGIASFDEHWPIEDRAMAFLVLLFLGPVTILCVAVMVALTMILVAILWLGSLLGGLISG